MIRDNFFKSLKKTHWVLVAWYFYSYTNTEVLLGQIMLDVLRPNNRNAESFYYCIPRTHHLFNSALSYFGLNNSILAKKFLVLTLTAPE